MALVIAKNSAWSRLHRSKTLSYSGSSRCRWDSVSRTSRRKRSIRETLGVRITRATELTEILSMATSSPRASASIDNAPDDAPRLTGDAVDLVEGLTQRAPLDHDLPDDQRWMVDGLREVFQPATP